MKTMKLSFAAMGAALLALPAAVSAAQITYEPSVNLYQGSTTQDFVSTTGTLAVAFNAINTDTGVTTVNGVPFQNAGANLTAAGATATVTGTGGESITLSARGITGNSFGDGEFNGDGDIFALIASGAFGVDQVTLGGLTPGVLYEIQIIGNDARGNRSVNFVTGFGDDVNATSPSGTLQLNNSPANGDPPTFPQTDAGDYIIGSFVADATTQSFPVFGSGDGGATFSGGVAGQGGPGQAQINAIQLRVVPEPGAAMALLGAGSLMFVRRRRGA